MPTAELLPIALVSLTWRDASTRARAEAGALLADDLRGGACVLVQTCARALAVLSGPDAVWEATRLQAALAGRGVQPMVVVGADAALAALRIAVGLDSYVEGEADIGHQMVRSFSDAVAAGRVDTMLHLLFQTILRTIARCRGLGTVRAGRGLGALAVDALRAGGLGPGDPVGVVGAGALGQRVLRRLRLQHWNTVKIYNRSKVLGAAPLGELGATPLAGVVVCTSGPEGWLAPPPDWRVVVDLGLPAQVRQGAAGCVTLDQILGGAGLLLAPEQRAASEVEVQRALEALLTRQRARRLGHTLGRMSERVVQFSADPLEQHLGPALAGLPADTADAVRSAARAAVRRLGHELICCVREDAR